VLLVNQVVDLAIKKLCDLDDVVNVGLPNTIFPMADSSLRYAKGLSKLLLGKTSLLSESADRGHRITSCNIACANITTTNITCQYPL
jgi:hypothetical protein